MRNLLLAILVLTYTNVFSQKIETTNAVPQKITIPQDVVYTYYGTPRAPADSFITSVTVKNLGRNCVIALLRPSKARNIILDESYSLPPGTNLDKVSVNDYEVVQVDRSKQWTISIEYLDGTYYDYKILNKDSLSNQFDIVITTGKYQKIVKQWKPVPDVNYLIAKNIDRSDAVFKAVWMMMKE